MKVSAPAKIILIGEHYVVYGAPAVAFTVDRYNHITFQELEGEVRLEGKNPGFGEFIIYPDGRYVNAQNRDEMRMFIKIYQRIIEKTNLNKALKAVWSSDGTIKGMGASASFSTALALGLYKVAGIEPSEDELFECAQIGDEYAHGGRPSGIDAKTVVSGTGIIFKKEFNPVQFTFTKTKVVFPKETGILIVDTYRGKRGSTADLVKLFAEKHNISKPPSELTDNERAKLCFEYDNIYKNIIKELTESGNPETLGKLFLDSHFLLRNGGVSTDEIEEVIKLSINNGALGAKLTGAGGPGGAVIVYAYKKDFENLKNVLNKAGYNSLDANPAVKGVGVHDKKN
ncbi:hypothetical protein KO465_06670 [Candidatus Micrarchaeota archaeon]|nr:hypothetical protein [Candidatus Micrarchaeota archaeon]